MLCAASGASAAGRTPAGLSDQLSVHGLIVQGRTGHISFVSTGCSLSSTDEPGQAPGRCSVTGRGTVAGPVLQTSLRVASSDGAIASTLSLCVCDGAGTGSGTETDRDTGLPNPVDVTAQLTARTPTASRYVTQVTLVIDVFDRSDAPPTVFNQPGTFSYTVPAGVPSLTVTVVGGGGGGGGAFGATVGGGGGGGSGGATTSTLPVSPGDVCTVSVGTGGAGGAGRTGPFNVEQPGVPGGTSSVTCPSGSISATGGGGGFRGTGGLAGTPGGNPGAPPGPPVACPGPGTAVGGAGGASPAGGAGSGGAGGSANCAGASAGAAGGSGEVVLTP